MSITPGQKIGPYEILGLLGKGGMGEVYRTRDTRLKRDLAIKILPDDVANDPDRILRFQREAEVLASLNHPNVAQIYGFETAGSIQCILMELVDGPSLEDRIAMSPMRLAEILTIAKQLADALEYAHEQGVIHRDLKPANIKITSDGKIKVLDFGLAKAMESRTAMSKTTLSNSPTLSMAATGAGYILGTAAYMAPEQAKGKPVDRRADIWAFGVIVYEMLTGQVMFSGETAPETMAFVMTREPDWKSLPAMTPSRLHELLLRCLTKDPRSRLQAIGDARIVIEDLIASPGHAGAPVPATAPARTRFPWIPWTIAGLLALTTIVLALFSWRSQFTQQTAPVIRLETSLGGEAALSGQMALSPDGRTLVYRAGGGPNAMLYLRRLDQLQSTPIPATAGGRSPFFSPDGRWLAFFSEGALKKMTLNGTLPMTLAEASDDRGGTWLDDGTIVFAPKQNGGLMRVSSNGGTPTVLTTLAAGESTHRWPAALPDSKGILFTVDREASSFSDADIAAISLPGGDRKVVHRGGFFGRYLASGDLLYASGTNLFAAPFDLGRLALASPPSQVVTGVASSLTNGSSQFAVSGNGSLVFASAATIGANDVQLTWMDKDGTTPPMRTESANYRDMRFSPDGKYVAVEIVDTRNDDIWVYDWQRDVMSRLTFDAYTDIDPAWTPDGHRVTFAATHGDGTVTNLYSIASDGSGEAQRLSESPNPQTSPAWHPQAKFIAFVETRTDTRNDIMILPMDDEKPGQPTAFLASKSDEAEPAFSPDGRWLAYQSNESGSAEVYVRPFPGPGRKEQISSGGGAFPTWAPDGKELFYRTRPPDPRIMVVPFSVRGSTFIPEKAKAWTAEQIGDRGPNVRNYDISPDGKRVLIYKTPDSAVRTDPNKVTFVLNFFQELRRLNRGR